jgi:PAS domain S-box-containing protein
LIAGVAVAVLFALALATDAFDHLEAALGSRTYLDESLGLVVFVLAAVAAIAARRTRQATAERQRRLEAESRFQALVEGSPSVTYTWDTRRKYLLYISPQIGGLTGYQAEAWIEDQGLWERSIHPADRERVMRASDAGDDGEPYAQEYRLVAADGRIVWVHDESARVELAPDGRPSIAHGVLFDITARKEAELQADEAEARFRTIVERVPAIAYVWDSADAPGDAPASYISPQIEVILGYTAQEWIEQPDAWSDRVHPEDVDRVMTSWQEAVEAGIAFSEEYRIRRADGEWVWLRDEANPVSEGDRGFPIYQGVIFDITSRKEAEQALHDAQERWLTLLEHLPVTAYMIEYDAADHDIVYDRWIAPGITELLGYTPEEWLADHDSWVKHVHPDDRDRAAEIWRHNAATGGAVDIEYRMVRKDGAGVWVREETVTSVDGRRVRSEGVFFNITERKTAELALAEAEARFRALVEQLPAITYIEEAEGGRNLYISPQIEAVYGYTAEEWMADPKFWEKRLHPDDRDWVVAENEADTGDSWSVDYRSLTREGKVVWVHNEARLVRDQEGHAAYWQGLVFDITERKHAEERLREAEERYRALVEQLPVAVYTDAVDEVSTALYVSPRYEEITGYSPEQRLLDPSLWVKMLHPDDRERVLAESERTNETGEPFDIEYRIVAGDGRTVWLHDHAIQVQDAEGKHIWQGVLQDVTERRIAQDALSRRDAILQATGFAAEQFLRSPSWKDCIADVLARLGAAGGAHRASVFANETEAGEPATSLVASWHADERGVYHDQERGNRFPWSQAFGRWAEILSAGQPLHGAVSRFPEEERGVLQQGDRPILSLLAVPVFVQDEWWGYVALDDCEQEREWHEAEIEALVVTANTLGAAITRERAAARLAETEARYRTLIEQIPAITYIETAGSGNAEYFSPQTREILGYGPEEWGSWDEWLQAIHPEDRERVVEADRETNESGEPFRCEYRLIAKDGHVVWVRDEARLVRGDGGEPLYRQGVRFDITAEKGAEEQLRAAEERYRLIVEKMPAITYLDEVAGEWEGTPPTSYISPQVETILGFTPEEWMANPSIWLELVDPEDRERARQADAHHYETGEPLDIEIRVRTKDGQAKWLKDQAIAIRDDQGTIRWSQGILLDITERKVAEQALNEAEQRYRSLIETIPAVTYIEEIERPWLTTYVSPQIESIFGYTADAWCNEASLWRDNVHPDDAEATVAAVDRHNETGEPYDVIYRFRHADGHWMWVRDQAVMVRDEHDRTLYSQGVLFDMTDAKVAEERLRDAEERYRGIVEHIPAAIYLDRIGGTTESIYVSPQIEAITGVTPQEWIEDPEIWLKLTDIEDKAWVRESYQAAAEAGEPWAAEYRMHRPDGRMIWVHDETTFLHNEDGQPVLLQGVIFDITERKLAEEALRESEQREREAAERLRSLDEMKNTFLAAVSHELRSPLTSILGLSLTLERTPDMADTDRGDLLDRLATNARKLDHLLKDLLDIDRLKRGVVEPRYRVTDVGALVRRTVEGIDALAGRDVIAETDPVVIAVDPAKVERIVENLLMNAARHTAPDRKIWLRVSAHEGGALIIVEDDGPGVPLDLKAEVFEPFRQGPTASSHSPGTGIGLSLVARFAELHGGRAWVEDREGGGASFRVFLPAADVASGNGHREPDNRPADVTS